MTSYWTGTQWKEFTDAQSLDYENEDGFLPNRAERKMQAGRSWPIERSCDDDRGYGWERFVGED